MKLVELKCKNCGAILKIEPGTTDVRCEHCKARYKFDDEARHIKYDDMEKAGYDYEKGKLKARQEHELEKQRQKAEAKEAAQKAERDAKMKKWIILAWIFLFPIMLTYWLWTKSKLDNNKKIIITAVVWIFFLGVGFASYSTNPTSTKDKTGETISSSLNTFESFVENYNSINEDKISELFEYDVKDQKAGYYQTEFRLNAYNDATAKLGKINSGRILLVEDGHGNFRVYAFTDSRESANAVTYNIVKAIDPTVLAKDINKMLEDSIVNGSPLYGDIDGIVITDSVMVKSKNKAFTFVPDNNEKNVALRKCTTMEASDIYTTGVGQKTKNIFEDAKNTCESLFNSGTSESFYAAINDDWTKRSEEQIDGKPLSYYVDRLGW